ncbi:predicted protein [Uncinocarpus reesii 1704]|uniref:Uncharacterized protein n=1 Tax=Uncinocarpus reesii (strain UAMH 1704) TaxID=336963 RepID=C4JV90_UNCRE|nr:uncharacterized protein UREG_06482 [Uncinocarpus reesii 1704]EEP81617.1 predicted protein [Uncinocarpus reesii 1704]
MLASDSTYGHIIRSSYAAVAISEHGHKVEKNNNQGALTAGLSPLVMYDPRCGQGASGCSSSMWAAQYHSRPAQTGIGLFSFYRRFISFFARIIAPLQKVKHLDFPETQSQDAPGRSGPLKQLQELLMSQENATELLAKVPGACLKVTRL